MLVLGCGGNGKKARVQSAGPRSFPKVAIPEAYTDDSDRLDYSGTHYWDAYLEGEGATDSLCILGVRRDELEQALANYIALLGMEPLPKACKDMESFFDGISAVQQRDTASQFYTAITQTVASYLYDPNSPLRDEDLYLPFVQGLAESPFTREDMRPAYRFEAMMCAICPKGSIAPDFTARRADGSSFTLHSVKAPYTLLFFSNPGCQACREIVERISASYGDLVAKGTMAVVNIYIDDELDAWREYVSNYPREWYSGYDYKHVIRDEILYNVRAIPSLYLLDSSKHILGKDIPFERLQSLMPDVQ